MYILFFSFTIYICICLCRDINSRQKLESKDNSLTSADFSGSDKENIDPYFSTKFRRHIMKKIENNNKKDTEIFFSQQECSKRNFESISMSQPCYRNDIGEGTLLL